MKFDHAAIVQRAHLSQPNSGLPEFGNPSWPKSDKFDFGWERSDRARLCAIRVRGVGSHDLR